MKNVEANVALCSIGISAQMPVGSNWKKLSGKCVLVDISSGTDLWCVSPEDHIFKYSFGKKKFAWESNTFTFACAKAYILLVSIFFKELLS